MTMKRGFTIVEILVVIAVLSILITLAAFGSTFVLNDGRNSEGLSKMSIIKGALERYYSQNNEYPSAASLAGGGNGRSLSTAQYSSIANTLKVNIDALNTGRYKFMPCANGSALCCTVNANGECELQNTDTKFIVYMTRSAADVTGSTARSFKTLTNTGCIYTLPAPITSDETGYSAYFLAYFNPSDQNPTNQWRWYTSDVGAHTRNNNICNMNTTS